MNAADSINREMGNVQFIIAATPGIFEMAQRIIERWKSASKYSAQVVVVPNRVYDILANADLALAASGTVTLEAAILGTPMVIIYLGSRVMMVEKALRRKILEDYIGLPNIIAGREICPELIAEKATVQNITTEALKLLNDSNLREEMKWNLSKVKSQLGQPGAIRRSAEMIARFAGLPAH